MLQSWCYYSVPFLNPVLSCMSCAVLLSQEREAQSEAEPRSSEPTERELALQEALNTLQQEKDTVTAQFQTQVRIKGTHAWSPLIYSLTRTLECHFEVIMISFCNLSSSCETTSSWADCVQSRRHIWENWRDGWRIRLRRKRTAGACWKTFSLTRPLLAALSPRTGR